MVYLEHSLLKLGIFHFFFLATMIFFYQVIVFYLQIIEVHLVQEPLYLMIAIFTSLFVLIILI